MTINSTIVSAEKRLMFNLTRLLITLGFQTSSRGFANLKSLILLMRDRNNCTLKEAYSIISAKEDKPEEAIASRIRGAIKTAYYETGFKPLEQLMKIEIFSSRRGIPSTGEFVSLINEYFTVFWDKQNKIAE